jgi:chitinase
MRFYSVALCLSCVFFTLSGKSQNHFEIPLTVVQSPRLVGYYFGKSARSGFDLSSAPVEKLTDLIYSNAKPNEDGTCTLAHPDVDETNFEILRSIKAAHPNLHLLLSVGGAPPSTFFSKIASSKGLRMKFAESCVELALKNGFDGLDIDWEYPVNDGIPGNALHPEDRHNFVSLLKTTRDVLDRRMGRKHGLLTAATTAYWNHLPDLALNTDAAVRWYLSNGVPAQKIVLGVPFYGTVWTGVSAKDHGLFQSFTGREGEGDGVPYRKIHHELASYTRFWDEKAQAPWLYSSSGVMISYEDEQALTEKVKYVWQNHLGGIMFWEISEDDEDFDLLNAIYTQMRSK